jgi:hypothetical protein
VQAGLAASQCKGRGLLCTFAALTAHRTCAMSRATRSATSSAVASSAAWSARPSRSASCMSMRLQAAGRAVPGVGRQQESEQQGGDGRNSGTCRPEQHPRKDTSTRGHMHKRSHQRPRTNSSIPPVPPTPLTSPCRSAPWPGSCPRCAAGAGCRPLCKGAGGGGGGAGGRCRGGVVSPAPPRHD